MSVRPSRRLVLTGALTLSAGALTGCGVRLEDDAPDLPFVPKRDPIAGESALLAMLGALEADGDGRDKLLRTALREAQVPAHLLSGATAPTAPAEIVAAFEGAVRDCGPGLLELVGQLTATHRITAGSEAEDALWTPAGTTAWKAGEVAAEALQATRATMYALDLIAARAKGATAKDVLEASEGLRSLSTRQTTAAGKDVKPVRLGYDVPHDVTAAQAKALGTECFVRLQAAYADGFAGLGGDRSAALEVVQWMVTAERLSRSQFPQEEPELFGDGTQPA